MKAVKRAGSWRVQVQHNGKRYSFTAKRKKDVLEKAQDFLDRKVDASLMPLGEAIDQYIEIKRNILSPATVVGYEKIRKNNLQDLMDISIRDLDDETIQRSVNIMAADHAPKTVANAYGLVSATLGVYAPNMHPQITLPSEEPKEYDVPVTRDLNRLLDAAGENMKTAIMLAAFCSMRRSEIVALESDDINGKVIHVRRAAVHNSDGETVIKSTKTYKGDRYVTAPDILLKHIKGKEGHVCPIALSTITKEFGRIRKKAGVTCRFHDLRHYYASVLHALEVPDQYIMDSGGWKSPAMLHKVYRNTLSDFEKKNARKITRYWKKNIS